MMFCRNGTTNGNTKSSNGNLVGTFSIGRYLQSLPVANDTRVGSKGHGEWIKVAMMGSESQHGAHRLG